MRKAALALLVTVAIAVAVLAVVGAADRRGFVSGLAVNPLVVSSIVRPGQEACQRPIAVAQGFGQVGFRVGTGDRPGPEVEVTVRDAGTGARLGSGRLAAGYANGSDPVVPVGDIPPGREVAVCVRNAGDRIVALIGSSGNLVPGSRLYKEGRPESGDPTMSFYTADRPSALGEVPEIFRRAALFRPAVVGAWTFWALVVLLVVAVPLLLVTALRGSLREEV